MENSGASTVDTAEYNTPLNAAGIFPPFDNVFSLRYNVFSLRYNVFSLSFRVRRTVVPQL